MSNSTRDDIDQFWEEKADRYEAILDAAIDLFSHLRRRKRLTHLEQKLVDAVSEWIEAYINIPPVPKNLK